MHTCALRAPPVTMAVNRHWLNDIAFALSELDKQTDETWTVTTYIDY